MLVSREEVERKVLFYSKMRFSPLPAEFASRFAIGVVMEGKREGEESNCQCGITSRKFCSTKEST